MADNQGYINNENEVIRQGLAYDIAVFYSSLSVDHNKDLEAILILYYMDCWILKIIHILFSTETKKMFNVTEQLLLNCL